jgi:CO/xanthine dehydrogenase FAD-binding subunit
VKPPPFEYHNPRSIDETLALLAEHADEAKVLAGGQSLVPLLNFRLARPERIVDINDVDELDHLDVSGATVRIGALTRQATLEHSTAVAARIPLLTQAVRWVGHVQIRNRGTVGGSVAHADAAAELPVALTALEARFHVRSSHGARTLAPGELFLTHLTTSLEPDELLTEIEVPVPPVGTGSAFVEYARRHGDFALGGAAVLLTLGGDGRVARVRVALLAAADAPLRATSAEDVLMGNHVDEQVALEAGESAVDGVNPTGDIHGGTQYRRRLLRAMVRRAVLAAGERATEVSA